LRLAGFALFAQKRVKTRSGHQIEKQQPQSKTKQTELKRAPVAALKRGATPCFGKKIRKITGNYVQAKGRRTVLARRVAEGTKLSKLLPSYKKKAHPLKRNRHPSQMDGRTEQLRQKRRKPRTRSPKRGTGVFNQKGRRFRKGAASPARSSELRDETETKGDGQAEGPP